MAMEACSVQGCNTILCAIEMSQYCRKGQVYSFLSHVLEQIQHSDGDDYTVNMSLATECSVQFYSLFNIRIGDKELVSIENIFCMQCCKCFECNLMRVSAVLNVDHMIQHRHCMCPHKQNGRCCRSGNFRVKNNSSEKFSKFLRFRLICEIFLMVDDCSMDECLKSSWRLVYYQVSGEPGIVGCSR